MNVSAVAVARFCIASRTQSGISLIFARAYTTFPTSCAFGVWGLCLGYGVWGFGFLGLGFWVLGFGFRVLGFGFGVWGLGFGV